MRRAVAARREPASSIRAIAVDAAIVAGVLTLVLVGGVFLPLGLVAAAAQEGLSLESQRALGQEPAAPLRLFRGLQSVLVRAWPLAVAVVLAAAGAHVLLRRALRRGLAIGDSLAWDAFASPWPTAVLAAGACAVVAASREGDVVATAVFAGAASLASFVLTGLVAGLGRRHPRLRTAAAALLVAAVVARLGAEAWGRSSLRAYDARRVPERASEDARRAAHERPVLRGDPIDEDAWPRYRTLAAAVRAHPEPRPLASWVEAGPFDPLPPEAHGFLAARREDLTALLEAARCRRCVPELPRGGPASPFPSLLSTRAVSLLLLLDGRERARGGDLAGAADDYLDAVRVAGDLGRGMLIHGLVGVSGEEDGLRALGRLVHSGRLDRELLLRIEDARARLQADRVSVAECLAADRRLLDGLGADVAGWDALVGEPLVLPAVVPYRALAARAVNVADPLRREFEQALAADDEAAWARLAARSDAVAGASWNPLLRLAMGYGPERLRGPDEGGAFSLRLFLAARRPLAWYRLVQAAVAVELARTAAGRYPGDAASLHLPVDPFAAPAPLEYRRTAASYTLRSAGFERHASLALE